MYLEKIRTELEKQLKSKESINNFDLIKSRHSVLIQFEAIDSMIEFLHRKDQKYTETRSSVTRALLMEAQRCEHSTASAILMTAFFPGLLRIYKEARRISRLDTEELEMLVLETFLSTVDAMPLDTQGERAVFNLVFNTRRDVFQALCKEITRARREEPRLRVVNTRRGPELFNPEQLLIYREIVEASMPEQIVQMIFDQCRDEIEQCDKKDLEIFLNTSATNKPLIEYLKEQHPNASPEEIKTEYRRLRKRRQRFVSRIRNRLSKCDEETALLLRAV